MVKSLKLKTEEMTESKEKWISDLQSQLEGNLKLKKKLDDKLEELRSASKQKDERIDEFEKHKTKETSIIDNLRKEIEKYKKTNSELSAKWDKVFAALIHFTY